MSVNYDCDILVRGGGIVGRALAMLLAHDGLNVALVEHPSAMDESEDPRAYAINEVACNLLCDLRVWPQELACPVYDMHIQGDAGGRLDFSAWRQETSTLTHIVPAIAVEQALDQALRFQSRIQRFNALEHVELPLAKLTAICEGRDSSSRDAFGFKMHSTSYGHTAISARLSCECAHGQIARQWFSGDDILALLPLAGDAQQEVSLVWSLPTQRAQKILALPAEEFEIILRDASHDCLGALCLQTSRVSWDLRYAHAQRWIAKVGEQTAVLVGDAAHAMHPLAGQGLNTGLGDVIELAKVLRLAPEWRDLGDERLLRPYERARKAAFMKMGRTCDAIFHLYTKQNPAWRTVRNLGMNAVNAIKPVKNWLAEQARHG